LQRCLNAILAQTHPPEAVLVINNASTDGTAEMLEQQFPGTQRLDLSQNLGEARGFHFGIAWAVAQGFTWVSVMDSRGRPAPDCFAQLLACPDSSLQVRGPLVLEDADESRLAFALHAGSASVNTVTGAETLAWKGVIRHQLSLFNGVFIASSVIQTIGLPDKEVLLWGDEYEYLLRMKRAGTLLGIVVAARFCVSNQNSEIFRTANQ
jgi:rhamnopyranosyl-N-acetylglucosaminyl-diphospho-decaprenol beta-1,3/1,4-galactofuranosyltransferase